MADNTGVVWTLQQFATGPTCEPWYALQRQNDAEVLWQFTGYRHEIDAICKKYGIAPKELPPTAEEEFLKRSRGGLSEGPYLSSGGRCR